MSEEMSLLERTKQCRADSEKWFGDMPSARSLTHQALALAGEVGEFCNIVKKVDRGSRSIRDANVRLNMAMELTDIFVYLLNLASLLNIDLNKTYDSVRANNNKRFTEERVRRENARKQDMEQHNTGRIR